MPQGMRFDEVEKEAAWLRQERAAGRLTEEQFKARLKELMLQDENGNWWMVGQQSGEWYRSEAGQWVRASPPLRGNLGAASYVPPMAQPERRRLRGWAILVVAGLAATVLTGLIPAAIIVLVLAAVLRLLKEL